MTLPFSRQPKVRQLTKQLSEKEGEVSRLRQQLESLKEELAQSPQESTTSSQKATENESTSHKASEVEVTPEQEARALLQEVGSPPMNLE